MHARMAHGDGERRAACCRIRSRTPLTSSTVGRTLSRSFGTLMGGNILSGCQPLRGRWEKAGWGRDE